MDPNYAFTQYPFTAAKHAVTMPACIDGIDPTEHPVIIIGAGPVGLTLALTLANHGVRSVVIEQDSGVCYGSRAICISRRSLQIFDRLGVLDQFMAKGLPWTEGRSYFKTEEVLHFSMPHDVDQRLPPMLNIQQFYIEQYLADAAARRSDLIDLRWNSKVSRVINASHGAEVHVETPLGEYVASSQWLVACDGGRSIVRGQLGLELKGTSYEGRYVVADIHLKSTLPTGRLAWFDPPSNPGSSILMHKQPDDVWRIDYQLGADEDAEEAIKPAAVIPRVKSHLDMMGESRDWSPIWITIYKAHALTLDSYRVGRTLFAGDAAHLLPIFGVRGANSGIDDADNLGWKLALVIKNGAADELLDTYSEERVLAARENLSFGAKSTEFMTPPSFAFEMMRRAVLSLAKNEVSVRPLINPRQSTPIDYFDCSLNIADEAADHFSGGPVAGTVLPDAQVMLTRDGRRHSCFLSQALSSGFDLLVFDDGAVARDLACVEDEVEARLGGVHVLTITRSEFAEGQGTYVHDVHAELYNAFDARPGTAYLVRPDGYVLARWRRFDLNRLRALSAHILRTPENS